MRSSSPRERPFLPFALAALSGAAVLVVETTWLRWFRLLFGATAPAASATLCAFFAGNAAGALLAARWLPRVRRPLRAYAALELGTAAWAALVPALLDAGAALLDAVYDGVRDAPAALAALRFGVALGATLPAAIFAGATLPALAAAAVRRPEALGAGGAALYATQLAGAATGTALAAFLLPEWLGVPGTYAAGIALLAGAGGLAYGRGRDEAVAPAAPGGTPLRDADGGGALLVVLAGLSGFGALAAQVLLIQAFAIVLNQSVYAFGSVLVGVLASLALGAALVAASQRRAWLAPRTLLGGALGLAALGSALFPALLFRATGGFAYLESGQPWPGYLVSALAVVARSAGLPLVAAGLVLPAIFACAGAGSGAGGVPAALLARLLAANTAGAIAGALAAPYLLLPAAGPWAAFGLLAGVYALPALLLADVRPRLFAARAALLGVAGAGVLLWASPARHPPARSAAGEHLLAVESTPSGVVAVVEREGERLIRLDDHYALGGTADRIHQERQGHLPLLLHPAARRVAFVGSATGISAGAARAHPVAEITLVEIVPGVARTAARFFEDANRGIHGAPATRVVLDDARNFLRFTDARFDAVVADLFVPWRAGAGSLYAREHFEAVRERLAPGGLFCQWLPLYQLGAPGFRSVAATFLDVFPTAGLFRGDFFGDHPIAALVGWRDAVAPAATVSRAAARLGAAGESDRWIADPLGVWALYVGPLAPVAEGLAGAPRNSDAFPRFQFAAARRHTGAGGVREPFAGLAWSHFGEQVRRAAEPGDPLYPDLGAAESRAAEGGARLQAAGAFWVAGRAREAARHVEAAAERLPPRLLRDAPPDPTAANLWPDPPRRGVADPPRRGVADPPGRSSR